MTAGRSLVALRPGVRGQLQARTDHHENQSTVRTLIRHTLLTTLFGEMLWFSRWWSCSGRAPRNTLLSSTTSLPSLTSAPCQCGPAYSTKFDHSLSHRSSQSGVRRSGAAPGGEGALLRARRGTAVNGRESPRT